MNDQIRAKIASRFDTYMLQDTLILQRVYLESDGQGGQQTTWRTVTEFKGRIILRKDSQVIIGEKIEAVTAIMCLAPIDLEVMNYDRIYNQKTPNRIYEIVGTNKGSADSLIQQIDIMERNK